eukprot:8854364-Prorocentrum_lima.AAC.1
MSRNTRSVRPPASPSSLASLSKVPCCAALRFRLDTSVQGNPAMSKSGVGILTMADVLQLGLR